VFDARVKLGFPIAAVSQLSNDHGRIVSSKGVFARVVSWRGGRPVGIGGHEQGGEVDTSESNSMWRVLKGNQCTVTGDNVRFDFNKIEKPLYLSILKRQASFVSSLEATEKEHRLVESESSGER
jgi:hypothetical protein